MRSASRKGLAYHGGLPVGVVTERDIIRLLCKGVEARSNQIGIGHEHPIITIEPDAPLGEAMTLMAEKNIRRVYVVDKGKIVWRITQTGAFGHVVDTMLALSSVV